MYIYLYIYIYMILCTYIWCILKHAYRGRKFGLEQAVEQLQASGTVRKPVQTEHIAAAMVDIGDLQISLHGIVGNSFWSRSVERMIPLLTQTSSVG